MKKLIPFKSAGMVTLTILGLVIVFHVCVMAGVVPADMVWGGRAVDHFLMMEAISIFINLSFMMIIALKIKLIRVEVNPRGLQIMIWLVFVIFLLNTLGNLVAINSLEKYIFTPLTAILSVLALRLAIE